jgi:tape measure domain-containing protein
MATVTQTLTLQDRMSPVLKNVIASMQQTISAMESVNRAAQAGVTAKAFEEAHRSIDAANAALNQMNNEVEAQAQATASASGGWAVMATGINQAIELASKAKEAFSFVTDTADQFTQMTARLNLINDGMQTTAQLQQQIYQAAQASRGSYVSMADSVSKLGLLAKSAFKNNAEEVQFVKTLNQMFAISGASAQESTAAMYQLTQSMASGKLQGDEFRSIMENAPLLAQAIAKEMGKTQGQLKLLSSKGVITADIIKKAMFSAAQTTNAEFQKMPMTWAQLWQTASNAILNSLQPILTLIGSGASWVVKNWASIQPILVGIAGGLGAAAVAFAIYTIAINIANGSTLAFFRTLLTNPFVWIAVAAGVLIGLLYQLISSVGGLHNAWRIAMSGLLTAWDAVQYGVMAGVYAVLNFLGKMQVGVSSVVVSVVNFFGEMRTNVLMILQNMVNGAIGIINDMIKAVNNLPGVSIQAIGQVTFGTESKITNDIAQQQRSTMLEQQRYNLAANEVANAASLAKLKTQMDNQAKSTAWLAQDYSSAAKAAKAGASSNNLGLTTTGGSVNANVTGGKLDDVSISDDDLKFLRDIANQTYINKYTTERPVVNISTGDVHETADIDDVMDRFVRGVRSAYATQLGAGSSYA